MWHKLLLWLSAQYLRHRAARRPPLPLASLPREQVRRVLLISSTALGDTLFSTPAIRALKECFPSWQLEVLGHRLFGTLLAHNPHVDRLWTFPGRNRGLLSLVWKLRPRHYELVIILHGNDPEATMLAYLTGSPYIIGSARSPLRCIYAATVEATDLYEHAIERRLNFVRLLGADTADKKMDLFLSPGELAEGEKLLTEHFGVAPEVLLALHPTGSDPYKWWPASSFIALGNYLHQAYQAALLIICGRKDQAAAQAIAAQIAGPTLVTGSRYPLLTVAALLSKCRLLVANDSGPLHMALALGVPSIALLGADHPRRIGPYQVDWGTYLYKKDGVCHHDRCLTKGCEDNRCLQAISVEEVRKLVQEWWEPQFWRQ